MSSSNKRERELARAKHARQQARAAAASARAKRRQRIVVWSVIGSLVLASGAGLIWAFLLNRDAPQVDIAQPVPGCSPVGEMSAGNVSFGEPDQVIQKGQRVTLTFNTNCGPISIRTLPARAPQTVNSMAFLAQSAFFDRTICHRLTTEGIYVLQCGDPTGTGSGGPGYSVPDENLPPVGENNYPTGTVAMANAGPGTAGSQFFITYQDSSLPGATPDATEAGYTVWGQVVQGLDIVQTIAAAGVSGGTDGTPVQSVMIDTVDVQIS